MLVKRARGFLHKCKILLQKVVLQIKKSRCDFAKQSALREKILKESASISESNGCKYYRKSDLRLGIICDRFFYDSFFSCCDLCYIHGTKWQETIKDIDCLMIVSTWFGLDNGDWKDLRDKESKQANTLMEVIDCCREQGIPVIFYSKEDPVNFDIFIYIASRCDYVFTTAEEVIPAYQNVCHNDQVYNLNFSINPLFHHPVGIRFGKDSTVVFSGAWREKYTERCRDLKEIFNGIIKAKKELLIIDRDFTDNRESFTHYPDKYYKCVIPAVDHTDLQRVHKLFTWAVNINTIKNSATMFANRIYELQANGNLLISNYSRGVEKVFPNIFIVQSKKEIKSVLCSWNDVELYEHRVSGIRRVMTSETCFDRFDYLCCVCGLTNKRENRRILVIVSDNNEDCNQMFDCQSYPHKTLLRRDQITKEIFGKFDMITFFDPTRFYGTYYLEDLINGFKYTDCSFITKSIFPADLKQANDQHFTYINDESIDKYCTVFWRADYLFDELLNTKIVSKGKKGFQIDPFNYSTNRQTKHPFEIRDCQEKTEIALSEFSEGEIYGRFLLKEKQKNKFYSTQYLFNTKTCENNALICEARYLSELYSNISII